MKELLERVVGLFPAYFESLLGLLSGPKRFVAGRLAQDRRSALSDALLFLGITFLLQWVLKIPFERGDPFLALGTDAVFVLLLILSYGFMLLLAWRLVGGRIDLQSFFTVHCYFSAIFLVLMSFLFLGITGTIRMLDPALHTEMFDAAYKGNYLAYLTEHRDRLAGNRAFRVSMVIQVVGLTAMLAWMFSGWGAYRQLSGVSRWRSFAAAILYAILCVPVLAITSVFANALIK